MFLTQTNTFPPLPVDAQGFLVRGRKWDEDAASGLPSWQRDNLN